ncbi:MAG: hypothetical protein KAT35_05540, partial [Candidatus Aenigmarchaeota archaeon]|nr:hypothetical protein [Candidatus Aenigmarchaeota archaeon]
FLSVPVSAYLEINAEQDEKTVYLGDEVSFGIEISNLRIPMDRVNMDISGEPQEWVSSYPAFIQLPGQSSSDFSVGFFPTGETTGEFTYTVRASSIQSPGFVITEEVTLNVIRPLDIEEFTVSKAGNELFINILMSSKDRRQAELSLVIVNNRGEFLERFSLTPEVNGLTMIEETFPLSEDILAGDYNVVAYLMGTPVRKECMFTVMPIHMITEEVKKTSSTFYDEFEITIVNEGNIAERQYVIYKNFPNNDWVTGLVTDPEECFVRGGEKTCKYVFSDLAPGESVSMGYRLDYWSIYATYALVLVAIFMLVFFGMRRATAPVIIKRHVRRAGGKHHVVLEVKNPFYHNLSNAIVRDWVSPLANVIHHEISVLKPLIRRSDAGTELIWKLGDIKPKETRIITYPIKALVSGSLKMPRAYIRYNKPNGRLRRLFSKTLIVNT